MRELGLKEGTVPPRPGFPAMAGLEPEWLRAARRTAYDRYWTMGEPDRTRHRWRYTDPKKLMPKNPIVPGIPVPEELLEANPAGSGKVTVADLAAACRGPAGERIASWLGRVVPVEDTPFTALNTALWSQGTYLEIPAGRDLEQPILLSQKTPSDNGVWLPRLLVVVQEGARATLIDESFPGADENPLIHRVVEVVLAPGAQLHFISLQDFPENARGSSVTRFRLEREANLNFIQATFGGGLIKADLAAELRGPGARAEVRGLVFGSGRQQFDHHATMQHIAPDTSSELSFRVALQGKARSVFTGMLDIGREAVHTQAYQENKNILLSDQANAVSIPELEIQTDEVQASHGATVGPIDEDQLYYLGSRGLARPEAEALVVSGFFEPLLARIPEDEVRRKVQEKVNDRLAG